MRHDAETNPIIYTTFEFKKYIKNYYKYSINPTVQNLSKIQKINL